MGDTLAQRIVRRCSERGVGSHEFARAIEKSTGFVTQLRNGSARPSEDTLRKILRVLDVPRRDHDAWFAAAGVIPQAMVDALLAHPETWAQVRAAVEGGRA